MAGESVGGVGKRRKFYQGLIDKLSASARSLHELEALQDDGASLRAHLESLYRQTGVCPEQLNVDPIPQELIYLWNWWAQLEKTRMPSMSGISSITYTEIDSWARLSNIKLTAFEVKCLIALDTVFVECNALAATPKE